MPWNRDTSRERIRAAIELAKNIYVTDYRSTTTFDNLALEHAVRVDGVHVYVDILNTREMLSSDKTESERCHKRYLRFMHLFQRVAHGVLGRTDAIKVAFQNQRLHFVVADPVGDEKQRLAEAVALAKLFLDLIERGGELHLDLANAKAAVGIDTGKTLAVRNGTRGDRELLFLGDAANKAAHAIPKTAGMAVGENARIALGWPASRPRTWDLAGTLSSAKLSVTVEDVLKKWKQELADTPLQDFQFSRPTPPLKDLDFETLTPANSRRLDCASIYADIDGYTRYVSARVDDDKKAIEAVRALHVIRKELRDTLNDLGGKKVRYIGDCLHGVIARGDRSTDEAGTVTDAVIAAGALRDAFAIAKEELKNVDELGLAIGLELGPTSLTRLGIKGVRDRIAAGLAVGDAEEAQKVCSGRETALGGTALRSATKAIKDLFDTSGKAKDLTYNKVVLGTDAAGDRSSVAKAPAPNPPVEYPRAHSHGPAKR